MNLIDSQYAESIKEFKATGSLKPIGNHIEDNPESVNIPIAAAITGNICKKKGKETKNEALEKFSEDLGEVINNKISHSNFWGKNDILLGKTIVTKYPGQYDITLPNNFSKHPIAVQNEYFKSIFEKNALVHGENQLALKNAESILKKNFPDNTSVVVVRALQGNEIEKKMDAISIFSKNIEFINHIKNYQGPLTVNTIKSLEKLHNVKAEKILIEDTHLISGTNPKIYKSNNEIENIVNSIMNTKLESLKFACNTKPKFKEFLFSSPNENYTFNINAVLNMHCSEKFITEAKYILYKKMREEYPGFFIDGKSIISVTISKVDDSHITYLEAAPILESLLNDNTSIIS